MKATCATTGDRGMMVAMGHGLCMCFCVCGGTTKNKEESKIVNVSYPTQRIVRCAVAIRDAAYKQDTDSVPLLTQDDKMYHEN